MKILDNNEAAAALAGIAVYKAYKKTFVDILSSHVSVSCCLLSHQLLGQ